MRQDACPPHARRPQGPPPPEKYKFHARDAQVRRLLAAQVRRLLAAQVPKRPLARLCHVDRNTLDRYIRQVINNPDAQQSSGE